MSKKIFVGNLSFQVSDFELQDMFKEFGEVVSAKVIVDKYTGRSRGFGFIEMSQDESADKAVQALNGADIKGRPINVSFAREQTERNDDRTSSGGFQRRRDNY